MSKLTQESKSSPFRLEGQFIGFLDATKEKPKYLWIDASEGERYIKISKELRGYLREVLKPGQWLEISGKQKLKRKTGELKLKADHVALKSPNQQQLPCRSLADVSVSTPAKSSSTRACVMLCQKSSCRKRGAGDVYKAVTDSLRTRGLDEHVTIKTTGCQKQCKKGPVMVLMPDKSRYTQVDSQQISTIVDKHFACQLKSQQN
ncbi:MAG: (2Fe-2S) ferredoxin domain-containing protein [Symploca sp. SIO3C6]|nr:(2Fe-2S) ferredoxin domain-containing protein [Symploca sp. SIO3C6]